MALATSASVRYTSIYGRQQLRVPLLCSIGIMSMMPTTHVVHSMRTWILAAKITLCRAPPVRLLFLLQHPVVDLAVPL